MEQLFLNGPLVRGSRPYLDNTGSLKPNLFLRTIVAILYIQSLPSSPFCTIRPDSANRAVAQFVTALYEHRTWILSGSRRSQSTSTVISINALVQPAFRLGRCGHLKKKFWDAPTECTITRKMKSKAMEFA